MEEAIREYKIALEIDGNNFESCGNLADAYFDSGRYAESLEEIKKAFKLKPDNPEVRFLLGQVHAKLGHVDLARDQLSALRALNPDYAAKLQTLLEE